MVGDGDRALGQAGADKEELGRLALGLEAVGLPEAAPQVRVDRRELDRVGRRGAHCAAGTSPTPIGSTRTALTLNSGVPISESPTSCVSQFTFCSAKWSAIQTRPG